MCSCGKKTVGLFQVAQEMEVSYDFSKKAVILRTRDDEDSLPPLLL
jgi:hypothetical protein